MLACIACSKDGGGEDTARAGTPSTKDAVKSLTSQIKDMVLKFSGSSKQSSGPYRHKGSRHHRHRRNHRSGAYTDAEDDGASDGGSHYAYLRAGSSSSTPAWDFTCIRAEGKWNGACGTSNAADRHEEDVVLEEKCEEAKEWIAHVEPGVQITFVSLPGGAGNDLKRIRFSREMFNKWQAQRWWGENFDRVMELYNVQRFSRQALATPSRSDDGDQRESFYSRVGSTRESPVTPPFSGKERFHRNTTSRPNNSTTSASSSRGYFPSVPDPSEHILPHHLFHYHHAAATAAANAQNNTIGGMVAGSGGVKGDNSSMDASRTTTSSRDEAASISISNASDMEVTEWVEQDEPGVYITIRELPEGTRELRRVRFSRERFGEVHAKLWWEDNRERIQAQYL